MRWLHATLPTHQPVPIFVYLPKPFPTRAPVPKMCFGDAYLFLYSFRKVQSKTSLPQILHIGQYTKYRCGDPFSNSFNVSDVCIGHFPHRQHSKYHLQSRPRNTRGSCVVYSGVGRSACCIIRSLLPTLFAKCVSVLFQYFFWL
jgi:hypothetical protein